MPRPVKEEPRDQFKTVRFTQAELDGLLAKAKASGRTLSEFLRAAVLQDTTEEEPLRPSVDRRQSGGHRPSRRIDDYGARLLADQVRRVGVNLNQIARKMNELSIPPPPELGRVIEDIREFVRKARDP